MGASRPVFQATPTAQAFTRVVPGIRDSPEVSVRHHGLASTPRSNRESRWQRVRISFEPVRKQFRIRFEAIRKQFQNIWPRLCRVGRAIRPRSCQERVERASRGDAADVASVRPVRGPGTVARNEFAQRHSERNAPDIQQFPQLSVRRASPPEVDPIFVPPVR